MGYGQKDHLVLNRQTFEWSANSFCRLFRDCTNAKDFTPKFAAVLKQLEGHLILEDLPETEELPSAKRSRLEEPLAAPSPSTNDKGDSDTSKWLDSIDYEIRQHKMGKLHNNYY